MYRRHVSAQHRPKCPKPPISFFRHAIGTFLYRPRKSDLQSFVTYSPQLFGPHGLFFSHPIGTHFVPNGRFSAKTATLSSNNEAIRGGKKKKKTIVGTNTTYLSYAINDYFGDNFRSVINRYRVAYAVNLLLKEKQKANIKNIYLRCGFLSKSTFYASFTKIMGVPPLQFAIDAERSPLAAEQYCPVKSKNAILSSLSSAYAAVE